MLFFQCIIIMSNFWDKWKGRVISMWGFLRHAKWNRTTCYWLGLRRTKDGSNKSAYLRLLLIIQFLSRLCNIFFSQINSTEGVLPNDEFWKKKNHFTVFKISVKMQMWWSNPYKMWFFLEGRLPRYFFQEMCSSGVVSKLYTKFQLLSLSKTAILEHP